jgi:hypothetical protein
MDGTTEPRQVDGELIIARGVHEVKCIFVSVKELYLTFVQCGTLKTLASLESAFRNIALPDISQLEFHIGATPPHLHVLKVLDAIEVAVKFDSDTLPQISGGDHRP